MPTLHVNTLFGELEMHDAGGSEFGDNLTCEEKTRSGMAESRSRDTRPDQSARILTSLVRLLQAAPFKEVAGQ